MPDQLSDDQLLNLYNKSNPTPLDAARISNASSDQPMSDDDLINLYSKPIQSDQPTPTTTGRKRIVITPSFGMGLVRGFKDVLDTGAEALASGAAAVSNILPSDSTIGPIIRKSAADTIAEDKAARDAYDAASKNSVLSSVGRVGGQILGTAPLLPGKAIQGINAGWRALPTISQSGETIAAPLVNRVGAAMGTGAAGGAVYGAATSSTNDQGVAENALTGAVTGAVVGPLVSGAAAAGGKVIQGLKNVWYNNAIDKLVQDTGIAPKAAKNVISRLDEAGYTPETAQIELNKLGPTATLADLDTHLAEETAALTQLARGKSNSVIKNTYQNRSDAANNEAVQIMNQKLGPKPNLDAEKEAIIQQARTDTAPDYQAAYASPQQLDVSGVSADIDNQLKNSVGKKTSVLNELKGYLYTKDTQGNSQLKTSIPALHEVRQGIDDMLDRLPSEGTSQASNTYRAASNVRDQVDAQLKTNSQMMAADQKFANRMTVKEGLDTGYNALKKGTYDQFESEFSAASPETQDSIRKGMRAYIGDLMDQASRGELAGAQQLFGKKSVNRKKFTLALGQNGTDVLDALEKEAAFRSTEKTILTGSRTATNLERAARYKAAEGSNFITDAIKAGTLDAVTGSPLIATGINAVRSVGKGAAQRLLSIGSDRMAESSADLLSRQGAMRNSALSVLQAVQPIQNRIGQNSNMRVPLRLPVIGAPIGEGLYKKLYE